MKMNNTEVRLIDGKAYQFEVKHKVDTSIIQGIYDSDRDTMNIHQGYYFDRVRVVNIQPLSIDVKTKIIINHKLEGNKKQVIYVDDYKVTKNVDDAQRRYNLYTSALMEYQSGATTLAQFTEITKGLL